ncbi:MAG: hypothetical protein IJZ79_04000 [Bacilli bacterium]|nr:hypothetical protein [Bacilli bacterium]
MKKIYIILMHTHTIPSKLIKLFTRYEYSHVGLSLDKSCNTIYSFGRKKFNTILNSGFSIEKKTGEFFNKFNKTTCCIYEVNITDKQYEKVSKILNDMKAHTEKYKYDYLGLIPRFFGIPITKKNRYVCSYFVATILEKTEIYSFDKKTCFVIPSDFEKIDKFIEIYRGSYKMYNLNN